jgi:hypothetical protein
MAKKPTQQAGEFKEIQGFFDVYRKIDKARGIDQEQLFAFFAEWEMKGLSSPGARTDFVTICQHGCYAPVLAAIVASFRAFPQVEQFWTEVICKGDKRRKAVNTFEKAASVFEEMFRDILPLENENLKQNFIRLGRIPLSRLISELRFYVRFFNLAEGLGAGAETRSLQEVSRYLLAAYVKKATGRFHDANVSGLLAEVIGPADYNEVAQRMWRLLVTESIEENGRCDLIRELAMVCVLETS